MTAQTPTPEASRVSALLASLSTVPPLPQPSVKEDFLAVIAQALTARPGGADSPPRVQPARERPSGAGAGAAKLGATDAGAAKTASTDAEVKKPADAAAPDPTALGLLLALLAAPLPTPSQWPAQKVSAPSLPGVLSLAPAPPAPAQNAAQIKPAENTAAVEPAPLPMQAPAPKEPKIKLRPLSGTSVANTTQRMRFISERNEIAGRIEQKLPLGASSVVSSADAGGPSPDGGAKPSLAFAWHETPAEKLTITNLSAKAASPMAPVEASTVEAPVRGPGAAPLERLEQMIAREVVTVRQTGVQTLGVELKLDASTHLFLQLTMRNGRVQASVRCDRGQFAPEEAQWEQLRQSLAGQKVELLPMTGGSNLNFPPPSMEPSRQLAGVREDGAAAAGAGQPAPARKEKGANRSRRNWESWA